MVLSLMKLTIYRGIFKICFFLIFILANIAAVQGQYLAAIPDTDTTSPTTRHLEEVVVRENRLSAPLKALNRNITIISRKEIDATAATSISEILSHVPGLDVRQRGPGGMQADIGIDGGTFDQTLVLLNGIKITDPQTGHNIMNLPVALSDIDHIEVLRGAAARIYGINALNGAINIVTRKLSKSGVDIHASGGSSFRNDEKSQLYHSYSAGATGGLVNDNSNQALSVSRQAGNGYRYNTGFKNYKAFYQASFDRDSTQQWNVLAGYVNNEYGANGFYAAPGDKEAEEKVETLLAAVSTSTHINPKWTLLPRISYRYTKDDYRYIRQTPDKSRNLHNTHIVDAELNNTFDTHIGYFGAGLEARYEHIKSSNLGDHERVNLGVYGEYKLKTTGPFSFTLGSYLNYNSFYGWQLFPGADVGYNILPDLKVFANVGTAQRLPTYTDLYYKSPTILGNDKLEPEKATYMEAGFRKFSGKYSFSTSVFYRQISRFIDYVKDSVPQPWQPQNFQRADTKGFTLQANYNTPLAVNGFFNHLALNVGYNYLSPSFKNNTGLNRISRYVLESLRHQFNAGAQVAILQHFNVSASARYCMRINYKDYTVVDTRISYKHKHFQLYADATNILDVTYIEAGAVPMPGRWMTLGGSIHL
jgi:vitamin B12 transporter